MSCIILIFFSSFGDALCLCLACDDADDGWWQMENLGNLGRDGRWVELAKKRELIIAFHLIIFNFLTLKS